LRSSAYCRPCFFCKILFQRMFKLVKE
jgi:hypothetical protein